MIKKEINENYDNIEDENEIVAFNMTKKEIIDLTDKLVKESFEYDDCD